VAGDEETAMADIYVQPGESHLVREPTILRTVLGSCVGVTFWHQRLGIAAICHPMLPKCPPEPGKLSVAAARRYVDYAIRDLAKRLDALGVSRRETQVKLFGGADVLMVERDNPDRPTVGRMNADRALLILAEEGYSVIAQRLGGRKGFHIDFLTTSGEVRLRTL
jgi:chemotaxis protein CheD